MEALSVSRKLPGLVAFTLTTREDLTPLQAAEITARAGIAPQVFGFSEGESIEGEREFYWYVENKGAK